MCVDLSSSAHDLQELPHRVLLVLLLALGTRPRDGGTEGLRQLLEEHAATGRYVMVEPAPRARRGHAAGDAMIHDGHAVLVVAVARHADPVAGHALGDDVASGLLRDRSHHLVDAGQTLAPWISHGSPSTGR